MKTAGYRTIYRRPSVQFILLLSVFTPCFLFGIGRLSGILPKGSAFVSKAEQSRRQRVDELSKTRATSAPAVGQGEANETIENQLIRLDALRRLNQGREGVNILVEKSITSSDTDKLFISDLFRRIQVKCVHEFRILIYDQMASRQKREQAFMETCGWDGMSDLEWNQILESDSYTFGNFYKPGDGDRAASITLRMNYGNSSHKAWFKVAPNEKYGERHLAQIAVYLLDRILGLYYAVPVKGIVIDIDDIKRAARENNSIRRFFDRIKTSQNIYVQGSLSAWMVERLHKAKINLPSRRDDTRRLTRQQKEDLEYVMLMWLSGLSVTPHNIQKIKGRPIAFDTDRAFRSIASAFWSHVYLCHFPRHVVEVLRFAKSHDTCKLSDLMLYVLQQDPLRPNRYDFGTNAGFRRDSLSMMDEFMVKLLDVVDECISTYGENKVLYRD
ncbi:uncharacterized protein [Ptychodera flava]|uniref:uncharacterized protein n=1 Tax=Ptychodera flava TaxID=63121 RepID=UPI00396A14CB